MSNPTPTGQDEARRARDLLAEPNAVHVMMLREVIARPSVEQIIHIYGCDALLAALGVPSQDRDAEEWNHDMEAAPKGRPHRVLVTVPSILEGEEPIVGEAWFCTEERNKGWWWSGTSPGEWYDSPISETNAEPIAWRHLPAPAALPVPADLNEGGGSHEP